MEHIDVSPCPGLPENRVECKVIRISASSMTIHAATRCQSIVDWLRAHTKDHLDQMATVEAQEM